MESSTVSFQVGETVWVQTAIKGQEELGTVLKLDCVRSVAGASDDGDDGGIVSDGIMVALTVGSTKAIYDPSDLRPYTEETKRASRRTTTAADPCMSITKPSRTTIKRSAVTPSPLQSTTLTSDQD
jgi:hypothetical protein